MSRRKDIRFWSVPVPKSLDDAVEEAVMNDTHVSKSDLIRQAVREKLERMGVRFILPSGSRGVDNA
jgi:Arc/MetJ-type ribon-helix-helix transcriptional regulator